MKEIWFAAVSTDGKHTVETRLSVHDAAVKAVTADRYDKPMFIHFFVDEDDARLWCDGLQQTRRKLTEALIKVDNMELPGNNIPEVRIEKKVGLILRILSDEI